MKLSEICAITDFFPDVDEWLWIQARNRRLWSRNKDDRKNYVGNFSEMCLEDWAYDCEEYEKQIRSVNQSLVEAFAGIKARLFDDTTFPQFLDSITFERDGEISKVCSPYGTIAFADYEEDDKFGLAAKYIEVLIESEKIFIEGFEVWDEFFACAIGAKFSDKLG